MSPLTTPNRVDQAGTMRLPPDPLGPVLPLTLGERYRLVARLGGGGMANVFRAIDTHLDRVIAVKLMTPALRNDPEFDARFRREAQIVSKLNDPHIVVVHDFGFDDEHGPYLVMELLEGATLRTRLNARGPLDLAHSLQLGEQVMLALAHAHGHGVIHRDLKPDNVFLLSQSGVKLHVRVLDFGVSRMLQPIGQTPVPDVTRPGSTIGTPRYMAPEQLAGKGASEQSDIYAAGVVLHEALTGQVPELIGPRLRDLCKHAPESLVRVVEQCLQANPDDRPISAAEAYLHLHELVREHGKDLLISDTAVAQLTARFRDTTPLPIPPKPSHRRQWLAGVVGGALIVGSVAWMMVPRQHPRPDKESVAGVSPGDSRDDAVSRLGKPTKASEPAESLRPFATLPDIVKPGATLTPEVLTWPASGVTAVLVGPEVRMIIVRRAPLATGRDLRIGDNEAEWRRAYPERPTATELLGESASDSAWGLVHRYAELGLAIEIRGGVVTGIALTARP